MTDMNDGTIRLAVFASIFILMAGAEIFWPKRSIEGGRAERWPTNWALVIVDSVFARLVFPAGGVGIAILAEENSFGLGYALGLNGLFYDALCFLLLDLAVWFQHWVSHKLPFFWRLHKVHHADGDVDVSTALRFHPLEILLSLVWKGLIIITLGVSPWVVLVFEIVLNGAAMFNHANLALPERLDRLLRWLIVTPDMHRIHHSVRRSETDSNYGFNLSIWDRIFRTYNQEPEDGHMKMKIGLSPELSAKARKLGASLWMPFTQQPPRS